MSRQGVWWARKAEKATFPPKSTGKFLAQGTILQGSSDAHIRLPSALDLLRFLAEATVQNFGDL